MKNHVPCLTAVCLLVMATSSYAHDNPAYVPNGQPAAHSGVSQARYNPWRQQPVSTQQSVWAWGSQPRQAVGAQQTAHTGVPTATQVNQAAAMYPLQLRQVEYRDYLQRYGVGYGNSSGIYGAGLPWWSDPVAVPYGPWAGSWPGAAW